MWKVAEVPAASRVSPRNLRPLVPSPWPTVGQQEVEQLVGLAAAPETHQRPDDADCWYYIGEARNQAGNLPAALEALQRAARLDERDTRTFNLMGRVLDRMGRPDEAMAMYRRSRELA